MQTLKASLVMSLSLLPANALVGLVTFGTMVGYKIYIRTAIVNKLLTYTRLKCMSWATANAQNPTSLEAAKTTRQSKSRRCSACPRQD